MKLLFNFLKHTAFVFVLSVLILSQQACKQKQDPTPTPNSGGAFSMVGTWGLAEAKVTIDSKTTTLTPVDIGKGPYPIEDITFTADNKYSRGKESGTWELSTNGIQLKLGALAYEFETTGLSIMQFGNTFSDFQAQMNITDAKRNAIGASQNLLNAEVPIKTLNYISYRVTYKKK